MYGFSDRDVEYMKSHQSLLTESEKDKFKKAKRPKLPKNIGPKKFNRKQQSKR